MEAVPRLHMLWFALKSSPAGTSFANLKRYIAEFYHEDPESYSKEVFALETLRNQAMHPTKDGCSIMKRYYCQLHSLQNRFPQLSERNMFTFTWKDLYQSQTTEVNDMRYEMAAVLFNIAASHTQVGASVTRGDVDGMKLACTHFQCAAWAFGELRERFADVNAHSDFMTPELLVFMQQVSFAQAQECILEKSLIDNRKPNIVAKVTAQIVVYYGAALAALLTGGDDGPVAQCVESSVYKLWKKYVRFKINYLNCILYLYQGQHAEEQQKMGERVTLYEAASEKLEDARKESKGLPDQKEINESLIFTADVVEAKRKNAKNENEFIYHETVPELLSISAVQGANLVNGIAFSVTDPEFSGEDIFARLVPMKAHEASSMYSEEKAKLLRKYGGLIEEKDTELSTFMSSLTLENLNISEEKANKIPQGIVDRCAALNASKSAIPELIHSMSQLADICAEVELNLKEIGSILATEERDEREFQTTTGVKRTPNAHITELTREYQKYMEAHTRAGESNDTLRKAMELHVNNLKILARPLQEIQQSVPKLSTELNTNEIFKDVKLILNKVNEMKAQRSQFHADLRIAVNNDDITSKVIAHGVNNEDDDLERLFERELAKHERLTQLIDQNLFAQKNILQALTDSYAKAAPILKTLADVKHKRESFFSSLAASYDVYEDLLAKSAKGLEFYKKLSGNVQKLLMRLKSARDVQDEERQQRLKTGSTSTLLSQQQLQQQQSQQPQQQQNQQQQQQKFPTATIFPKDNLPSIPTANTNAHAPTLRDYLKAKNTSAASIAAGGFHENNLPNTGVAASHNNTIPLIRPNPLGSETPTQAVCSSTYYPQINSGTTGIIAPNEPPPPYSLQQTQYYDPAAAGYTNPMYQQQQQNIAPPAYKLQASPNSQFTQLNTQFNQMGLQSGANYAAQNVSTIPQPQHQQLQPMQLNQQQPQMQLNPQHQQQQPQPTASNGVAGQLAGGYVGINSNNQSITAFPNQTIQNIYAAAQNTQQFPMLQQPVAASNNIPTTQPLYVATTNNNDVNVNSMPLPNSMLAMSASGAQQALPVPYIGNTRPQQQQHHQQQQQQQQQHQQQQQQATIPQASPLLPQQQQQQLPNPTTMQAMQSIAPQQMLLQQQSISSSNPTMATSSTASNLSGPYGGACSGSTKHPGYSFNPQTGQYEYGSGYHSTAAANASIYGQYTSATALKPGQNAGTTDSANANKSNFATGFDAPIISHTKTGNATASNASASASASAAAAAASSDVSNVSWSYYTPPYGYHSHLPNANQSATATYHGLQQPSQQEQQIQQLSQAAAISSALYQQQHHQEQQQEHQQQRNQQSTYIQSGSASIASTQTTKSAAEYASTPTQQPRVVSGDVVRPDNVTAPKPAQQQQHPTVLHKNSSNIDLLTDIDLSLAGVNGIPAAILPIPLLKPIVVPSPPSSHVSSSPVKKSDNDENTKTKNATQTELAAAIQPSTSITTQSDSVLTHSLQEQHQQQQQPNISSPVCDSPAAAAAENALRKPSYDNLSICSDLSSLDNFDFDSVSMTAAQLQAGSDKSNLTTNTISNITTPTSFLMKPYDPFTDDKTLKYFHKEVERYEKIIESLNVKMLNGNTQLSAKWKELQDLLSKDTNKRTTSIARLFPEKNRSLDCLPYDHARVKLEKNTDDYINAAFIKDLGTGCPNYIIAQTPLQNTVNDFWSMIWSQKARTVVCLHTPNEMLDPYWPQEVDSETHFDDFSVKCVKITSLSHCTEYNLKLSMHAADPIIDLSVLQIKAWTKSSPTQTLAIARNALYAHQQRCLEFNTPTSPLIMNCLTGSDRSELLAIAICAILATQAKRPMLINVVDVWYRICSQRQNAIRDTATLEQSMQIVLTHAHDVLNKRGIMTSYQMKIAPQVASKEKEEIKDPLNELDPLWKLK